MTLKKKNTELEKELSLLKRSNKLPFGTSKTRDSGTGGSRGRLTPTPQNVFAYSRGSSKRSERNRSTTKNPSQKSVKYSFNSNSSPVVKARNTSNSYRQREKSTSANNTAELRIGGQRYNAMGMGPLFKTSSSSKDKKSIQNSPAQGTNYIARNKLALRRTQGSNSKDISLSPSNSAHKRLSHKGSRDKIVKKPTNTRDGTPTHSQKSF